MAKAITKIIHEKSNKLSIVGSRQIYKERDIVNLREFVEKGDDLVATASGFTIPAEGFQKFFKALRKFGRETGLLPEAGEDAKAFELKPIEDFITDDEDDEEEDGEGEGEGEGSGDDSEEEAVTAKSSKKKNKKAKAKEAKDAAKAVKEKSGKKAKAGKKDRDADDAAPFKMGAFKKAIKKAFNHADDMSYAAEVLAMYKANRKVLKEELPKHAVNACEKAMENKKDDAYLAKAIVSLVKHVLGE